MSKVQIVEVGPRDGLQNESRTLTQASRFQLIHHLAASGVQRIEIGAFVSPQWVPQMAGSLELIQEVFARRGEFPRATQFSALVPNPRGMTDALKTPLKEIAVFGASSEGFSKHNINCTIKQSLERFRDVVAMAKPKGIKVRGYLSVAFGCPYEGKVNPRQVVRLVETLLDLGVYEVSIGDTIGVANPKQVQALLKMVLKVVPARRLAMHFHDTRGTALANVLASLESGIRVFDSSIGGLGGCPYAQGASGNLATEDLVYMLEGMGIKTGINLKKLIGYTSTLQSDIGRKLPARVAEAGLPKLAKD